MAASAQPVARILPWQTHLKHHLVRAAIMLPYKGELFDLRFLKPQVRTVHRREFSALFDFAARRIRRAAIRMALYSLPAHDNAHVRLSEPI